MLNRTRSRIMDLQRFRSRYYHEDGKATECRINMQKYRRDCDWLRPGRKPAGAATREVTAHRVAIIESDLLGGTCINTGCTPTKTMVASAQVAHYARNAGRWGVRTSNIQVELRGDTQAQEQDRRGIASGWEKKFEGKENPRFIKAAPVLPARKQMQVNGEKPQGSEFSSTRERGRQFRAIARFGNSEIF